MSYEKCFDDCEHFETIAVLQFDEEGNPDGMGPEPLCKIINEGGVCPKVDKTKHYIISEEQLKKFVTDLERRYGDNRVHTSSIHLSNKWDKPPEGFDEEIQFWECGDIVLSFPLKLVGDKK